MLGTLMSFLLTFDPSQTLICLCEGVERGRRVWRLWQQQGPSDEEKQKVAARVKAGPVATFVAFLGASRNDSLGWY